jgi:hypothetical protein
VGIIMDISSIKEYIKIRPSRGKSRAKGIRELSNQSFTFKST